MVALCRGLAAVTGVTRIAPRGACGGAPPSQIRPPPVLRHERKRQIDVKSGLPTPVFGCQLT